MKKIKDLFFSEKKLSGAIFGILIITAFAFIFGPNIYAQFALQNGGVGYGYGYGYGYGSGVNDGSYRIDGDNLEQYDYGYGFADTYTWLEGGYGSCIGGTQTRTVTCQSSVGTVADSNCLTTKPATAQSCGSGGNSGGGGGGGVNTTYCSDVAYGDFAAACFAGYQYRDVTTKTPTSCSLTAAQMDASRKLCGSNAPVIEWINGVGITQGGDNTASFIALEKNLIKKLNKALAKRLSGRILLQVEEHGEAWYVNPVNLTRYYLGRPADAFAVMRKLALGINNKDFDSFKGKAPARLAGRILLKVQDKGAAYYINPLTLKMHYMGRPADAFSLMRSFGLGITNADLRQIDITEIK